MLVTIEPTSSEDNVLSSFGDTFANKSKRNSLIDYFGMSMFISMSYIMFLIYFDSRHFFNNLFAGFCCNQFDFILFITIRSIFEAKLRKVIILAIPGDENTRRSLPNLL